MDPLPYDSGYTIDQSSASDTNTDVFTRHNDSVLCCSIDNRNRLAVSGGIDETAFVWDVNTKHVIFECSGHKESVVASAFSVNSTYVATGDLNGYIQVRNTTTGIRIFEYEIDEINWIMWHNTSEFALLAGTTKGDFWMWNVNDPASVKTFPSYGSATTVARLLSDGIRIVSGYGDGSVRVFDLKSRQAIFQLNESSQAEIISLDISPNNALIALGYIDSRVKLINLNSGKAIGSLTCKSPEKPSSASEAISAKSEANNEETDMGVDESDQVVEDNVGHPIKTEPIEIIDEYSAEPEAKIDENEELDDEEEEEDEDEDSEECLEPLESESVESVLFSPCGTYLTAANNSGSIVVWDVANQAIRCELHTGVGITRCAWSDAGNYITACLDGSIRIYDLNLREVRRIDAHSDQVLDIAYRNHVLVTASEDKTCKAIKLDE